MRYKFSVITPCYNAEKYIKETINSVLEQSMFRNSKCELEYIVVDGKSTDKTCEIVEKIFSNLPINYSCKLISEDDNGMYDALVKGFKHVTGDICAYINADDFYYAYAFSVVNNIMQNNEVKWLTGMTVSYNERSEVIDVMLPYRYKSSWIKKGIYGTMLPVIQQESTFWKTEMLNNVDFNVLKNCKLAGDFYLWKSFSNEKLNIVKTYLGGFRYRKQQLSENKNEYVKELKKLSENNVRFIDRISSIYDKTIWHLSPKIKCLLNSEIYRFDFHGENWEKKS